MSIRNYLAFAALLLCSNNLLAQSDSTGARQLGEVFVTATKYPVKLSETGKVLTVITRQEIERSAGKDLSQLLTEQTGMQVNGAYSNPAKEKSIYTLGAANDYTLVLIDGSPITDPSGFGGAIDLRLFPMDQIDHIEILKGSQSTLYGSDAIAGVINIITRKKTDKKLLLAGGANYGTYQSFNGNASVRGHLPWLDYNAGYSYTSSAGFSEATDTTGKANYDKDGYLRQNVQAGLTFHAGKKLDLTPSYRYSFYAGAYDADAFTDANYRFTYLMNNPGISARLLLPKGSLVANYSYTYAERNYMTDYGPQAYKGRFNTGDLYLTKEITAVLKLLAGFNFQGYQLLDTSLQKKNPSTNIASPYISLFIHTRIGLNAELGGRYNYHSIYGGFFTYSINTSYQVQQQIRIFLDFSTGFKAPTVTELFGAYGANPLLKPETSVNFQGGIGYSSTDKRISVSAMGFARTVQDLITYYNNAYTNMNQQNDRGLQVDARFSPVEKLSLTASWAYVNGDLHMNVGGKDTAYDNLLRRPRNTVNAGAGYQVSRRFFASLAFQWLSARNDLYFQPYPPYGAAPVTLSPYGLLNGYAEYKTREGKLVLYLDAKNITDTKFTEVYGYNTIGFTLTGGLRFSL